MNDRSDIIPIKSDNDAKTQAAKWLAKLDRGNLSRKERSDLAIWISQDDENVQRLQDLAEYWYGLNEPLSQLIAKYANPKKAIEPSYPFGGILEPVLARVKGIGIATICVAIVGVVAFNIGVENPTQIIQLETKYYSTDIGITKTITLEDGSSIYLNTNSVIEQKYSAAERSIKLISGEAIFDVAHDTERPFIVYTKDGSVRAVGTRFAIRVQPKGISVVVTEGRVALKKPAIDAHSSKKEPTGQSKIVIPVILSKGEAGEILHTDSQDISFQNSTPTIKRYASNETVTEQLAWAQGQLVFQRRELQYVVDEISRYTRVQIKIIDGDLRGETITGILPIGDVDLMLEGLENSLDAKVDWINTGLVHISKE